MGKYSAVVKGGLHANYGSTLGSIDLTNLKDHRYAAQALARKYDFGFRAIMNSLLVAGVGQPAVYNYPEIAAGTELGGIRPIVMTPLVNKTTVAQDGADIVQVMGRLSADTSMATPVPNLDRNPLGTR